MAVTYLSSELKTEKNGLVTVPVTCDYVVALVLGSILPVQLNGYSMTVKASVAAREGVPAVSIQTYRAPLKVQQPYYTHGNHVAFAYLSGAVGARPLPLQSYSATGSITNGLATVAGEICFGAIAGTEDSTDGQVTLTGDTVAFTLFKDETLYRAGRITAGDTALTIVGVNPGADGGYWYQPPPIYHPSELLTEEYYEQVITYHPAVYVPPVGETPGYWIPEWTERETIYHPPVYSDAWWEYPSQEWVPSGTAGKLSVVAVVITDLQIGSSYVSRPVPF
jgi:hypothetical protein